MVVCIVLDLMILVEGVKLLEVKVKILEVELKLLEVEVEDLTRLYMGEFVKSTLFH